MYVEIYFTNRENRLHKSSQMGGNMSGIGENRDPFLTMCLPQWNRGKVLGGSSAINFLCWTKPPADEVDGETAPSLFQSTCYDHHTDWERLGNKGWNWETFQKNLRKLEGFVAIDGRRCCC